MKNILLTICLIFTVSSCANSKNKIILSNNQLIAKVIEQLNINDEKIAKELITINTLEAFLNETIIVIPEIENDISSENDEIYYELTSHILIVNSITGKIKNHYSETSKTNGWISDAVFISEILIQPKVYQINKKTNAFAISVSYRNMSQPNPYNHTSLNLYTKQKGSLNKILNSITIYNSVGEVDVSGKCYGQFNREKADVFISKNSTNSYNDLEIEITISDSVYKQDDNGECIEIVTEETNIKTLKFENGKYKYLH